ncbi:MAG: ferritin family protein [Planctomycetaceae bacterium]|nr:ferritin family protein [Planctomycetaceae bacterium]
MMKFETLKDVLEFAISLEQASQEFYTRLAEQTESPSIKHFLLELVGEEKLHESHLREMVAGGWDILVSPISSKDMDRYIDTMNIPEPLDYKQAVKLARDKENASRMMYTILSSQVQQPELNSVLNLLAEQEQRHHDFFQNEYRRICVGEN